MPTFKTLPERERERETRVNIRSDFNSEESVSLASKVQSFPPGIEKRPSFQALFAHHGAGGAKWCERLARAQRPFSNSVKGLLRTGV